jgi:hypothetical protein
MVSAAMVLSPPLSTVAAERIDAFVALAGSAIIVPDEIGWLGRLASLCRQVRPGLERVQRSGRVARGALISLILRALMAETGRT